MIPYEETLPGDGSEDMSVTGSFRTMEEHEKQTNEKLRRERDLRGWSQQKVAESIGTSNQAVNRWENGQHKPGRYFQTLLCELFGKNAEELGFMKKPEVTNEKKEGALTSSLAPILLPDQRHDPLLDHASAEEGQAQAEQLPSVPTEASKSTHVSQLASLFQTQTPTDGQSSAFSLLSQVMTPAILEAVRDLGGQDMERSRRLFFQLFGTSVAALLGLSQDTEPGINVLLNWDQQILFEQQLAALWDVYHTGGTAQADYKLKVLLTHSEKSLRHSHVAELLCMSYQLQGSLYRDMMKYDDAHVFYQQAFEAAKELDDAELMSAALARRGVTLIQQNKATEAIVYLSEAHGLLRDHALPCLTGYIFQALSEAYAIAQQEHESNHHIDGAQQVLSDRGKVPERSHCQANTTSVTAQMGVNAVHLHHYAAAIPLIEQGMENYNPTFVRGRARLKAQQAEAYYGLGDIRACCQSATEAWILARAASSNKTFARLRTLQRDLILSPQKKAPEVVDLNWVMSTL